VTSAAFKAELPHTILETFTALQMKGMMIYIPLQGFA